MKKIGETWRGMTAEQRAMFQPSSDDFRRESACRMQSFAQKQEKQDGGKRHGRAARAASESSAAAASAAPAGAGAGGKGEQASAEERRLTGYNLFVSVNHARLKQVGMMVLCLLDVYVCKIA